MRSAMLALCLLVIGLIGPSAQAADKNSSASAGITGVFLTTNYPAMTVRAGDTATVDLSLNNYGLPPERVALQVQEVASGWKATLLGGGQPVGAAIVLPGANQRLQLKLEPPSGVKPGSYNFAVEANAEGKVQHLPITITVGQEVPAKLKIKSNFPSLRGSPTSSFKYRLTINNDSGHDAVVTLGADTPTGFQATFTEAYATQELTSIPIEAGRSKDIDVSVTPPHDIAAGDYKFKVNAKTDAASTGIDLAMTVVGQPSLILTGENDRVSANATAGKESPITLVLRNDGSAPAHDIVLGASTPEGWKATFDPKKIPTLAPGASIKATALLTPSDKAITGDYQMTFRANGTGVSQSTDFRITVETSTVWGIVGVVVIAAALVVVAMAVVRFGRR